MAYLHIDNLYKNQSILEFTKCFALEKVHGTSAHISWVADRVPQLTFFSGGEKHENFVALFDAPRLTTVFPTVDRGTSITIYGEAYGGKQQGMRVTYGDELRFIAFDVKVNDAWLSVPEAELIVGVLGLEFVPYVEVSTNLADLDRERDAPSVVALRRGCGEKPREGVILRPLVESVRSNGSRVIAKHKCAAFSERATPQKVVDVGKLVVLAQAKAIAKEWVTHMRLTHVLDKLMADMKRQPEITDTKHVIGAMMADVYREAMGEVVESRDANAAIGKRTALLFKEWLNAQMLEEPSEGSFYEFSRLVSE